MSNVKLFENQMIRSIWIEAEQKWYFSIIDVVAVLTDSANLFFARGVMIVEGARHRLLRIGWSRSASKSS